MRTKTDVDIGPERAATSSVIKALLADLIEYELEQVAIAVIRENRNRLQEAQELFEEIGRLEAASPTDEQLGQLRHDYRIAMLNLHSHHQVVSLVVERLGFVPEVDGQRAALN
ncbi:transcriptional repressor TraM [uncultured Nitratireductor sp.]|uniref:transcriptional repressor TraM n=1 Tax=uncultured Nitratireductor sp. TaxID=520953 RepID=UPI0025F360BC|nr:transcriptional repressor TraM [uncultured Nitratireductor sp.]